VPRFYVPQEQIKGKQIIITGSDVNHIKNVLRLRIDDKIEVFDSSQKVYLCKLQEFNREFIRGVIASQIQEDTELKIDITLAQCLPKVKKMDFIIQKATELGANQIIPVTSERSVPRIEDKAEKKITHWQKIAQEAAEQSGRSKIPKILSLTSFSELVKSARNYDLALIPWEGERENTIKKVLTTHKPLPAGRQGNNLIMVIGPEGGFSQAEIKIAQENGLVPISLGKRILRCETAALTCLALLASELER
jgi:16S rRNA (uracil1498-N3)-methyltransferase